MSGYGLSSRAIIGRFYDRLEANPGSAWIDPTSMLFTSDQPSEEYKWLGMSPAMQEWVGGRHAKGFRENGITITNKHYEATLEVLVREMRRDKTGQIMVRVDEMADRANSHWASLLSTLIINGETTTCYDGQFFFDTDHEEGESGQQSNDITTDIDAVGIPSGQEGSTTAPTAKTMQVAILKSVQQMYGFKDDQGEPLNEGAMNFLVMVPTPFMNAAIAAVTLPQLTAGESNLIPANGRINIDVVANPRLTWTTKFATFRTDGAVKPFIRQQETEVQMKAIAEGSELEFNEDKHHYGIDAWRNVGYGYWQHAVLNTLT